MNNEVLPILKIDDEFKKLIPPLSNYEYELLEANIVEQGCRDAICVWHNYIIDGHNRYQICHKHGIPFKIHVVVLDSKDEALAWICANQLGRRNISDETRKYLIGRRYEAEKNVGAPNSDGRNQYAPKREVEPKMLGQAQSSFYKKTAMRLGKEYNISHATVDKYAIYSRAIDAINEKEPALVPKILSGQVKISHENVVELSRLSEKVVKRVGETLVEKTGQRDSIGYKNAKSFLPASTPEFMMPSMKVKDMPEYDPDAELSSLVLTVPTWGRSIERAKSNSDLSCVSAEAKQKLEAVLCDLRDTIDNMIATIKEV